ncbi:MAG: indolepyruvate oxidoreductase subunit beta [Deltaproteobacteria bacterium]|nr:indolepyruvate oxidoreductase subunit beta [Deltaproteobacteria bacterium]
MDPIRLIIVAVGGQGNLLASRVLGEAALAANVPVRMSEIHGMAQRGGVVESAVLFGDVESTIISDGEADALVGFEPSETLRAAKKCGKDTVVITNLGQLPPFTVAIGKGVYPDIPSSLDLLRQRVKKVIAFDGTGLAIKAGNADEGRRKRTDPFFGLREERRDRNRRPDPSERELVLRASLRGRFDQGGGATTRDREARRVEKGNL